MVVSGTGTGVGKTWVAAELIRALRASGVEVDARKPVQSFDPDEGSTDADILGTATGERSTTVCPSHRSYPIPMAPPIAAEVLGRDSFTVADLVAAIEWRPDALTVVEGVGGPRSPLASNGDTVTLTNTLEADLVVLVAEPVLGGINATLLSAGAFGDRPLTVYLNRFRPDQLLHRTNLEWLTARAGLRVVTTMEQLANEVLSTLSPEPAGTAT